MTSDNVTEVKCGLCGGSGKLFSSSSIGTDLATFRAKNSLSRDKFSKLCGLSVLTIFNIEKGKTKPQQMSEQKIRAAIDSYKPEGDTNVNENVNESDAGGIQGRQAGDDTSGDKREEEPTRRVFYQAEDDDDCAEEVETEDGE
ncbi:MAG: helix-turn-helix transcriptional regulator [Candidatus Thorarchaeota archaeon]